MFRKTSSNRRTRRQLRFESLEQRRLMAADLSPAPALQGDEVMDDGPADVAPADNSQTSIHQTITITIDGVNDNPADQPGADAGNVDPPSEPADDEAEDTPREPRAKIGHRRGVKRVDPLREGPQVRDPDEGIGDTGVWRNDYQNPLGGPSPAILDTDAFSTCDPDTQSSAAPAAAAHNNTAAVDAVFDELGQEDSEILDTGTDEGAETTFVDDQQPASLPAPVIPDWTPFIDPTPSPFDFPMPQFNGPQFNGPQFNGPQFNGPQFNGPQPPLFRLEQLPYINRLFKNEGVRPLTMLMVTPRIIIMEEEEGGGSND